MKTFAKIASVLILAAGMTGATFAGTVDKSTVYSSSVSRIADQQTVGHADVAVTNTIRAWFTAHGVDGSKIDTALGNTSAQLKDDIDDLVADSDLRDELTALVNPVLKAALVKGQTENASMRIGRQLFSVSLLGAEDMDN